jgi:uncharacterized protein (DUF2336 family)
MSAHIGADEAARVRSAASAATPPQTLAALTADPSVAVRAAVALNPAADARAHTLLAGDDDERVRSLLARRLATLLPGLNRPEHASLRQQALTTLIRLVEDEAIRVRAAISDVVKEMPQAPRELILRLTRDAELSVFEPVIRLSPLLTTEDLLALIAAPPCAATVTAVARRPGISETVADAIAATADTSAIRALLANPSAAIREATLDALVARAGEHVAWHEPLVRRPALPMRAARALSAIVTVELLKVLARRPDLGEGLAEEIEERLRDRLEGALNRTHDPAAAARDRAAQMKAEGRLNEASFLAAVEHGDDRLAAAILALAAGVSPAELHHARMLRSAKAVISLAWRAGFSMRAGAAAQTMLAQISPLAILRPGPAGGFPLTVEEMRWQIDFLACAAGHSAETMGE